MKPISRLVESYLVAALWSSYDNDDNPMDANYSIHDIDKETIEQAEKDLEQFEILAGNAVDGIDFEQIGYDFWLTRNGHAAGFWDRGYSPTIEQKLMDAVGQFGPLMPYVDNGKVYFE